MKLHIIPWTNLEKILLSRRNQNDHTLYDSIHMKYLEQANDKDKIC